MTSQLYLYQNNYSNVFICLWLNLHITINRLSPNTLNDGYNWTWSVMKLQMDLMDLIIHNNQIIQENVIPHMYEVNQLK